MADWAVSCSDTSLCFAPACPGSLARLGAQDRPTFPRVDAQCSQWSQPVEKISIGVMKGSRYNERDRRTASRCWRLTCDFSMVAECLSHMGLMSRFCSRSRSPCWKNSSISRVTHRLYRGNGFVGFDRSAQWTRFSRTWNRKENICQCKFRAASDNQGEPMNTYLYPVCVVI